MVRAAAMVTAGLLWMGGAARADAQELPVSRLLPELVKISRPIAPGETGDHSQHFMSGLDLNLLSELNRSILFQATAFPMGPTGPVVASGNARDRALIGAGYTDSAFSIGSRRLLFNMTYQTTTFDTLDDLDLRDSPMTFYLPHGAGLTGTESDRDMMQQVVSLRLNRKVAAFSLNYGAGDRFDIGVTIPLVQMAADARVSTYIIRTASAQTPAVHEFDIIDRANRTLPRYCSPEENPRVDLSSLQCTGSSTARGIGDITFRGKATLLNSANAVAVAVDVRLPTGSSDELIGLGAMQIKPAVLWSVKAGRVGVRARADYTWSNGELAETFAVDSPVDLDVPDEMGGGVGLDIDILRRTTLVVDVIARRIDSVRRFSRGTIVFPDRGPGPNPSDYLGLDALRADGNGPLTQSIAALGLRFDVPGGVMAQVSALLPASGGGLMPQPMAVFSLTKRY